MKLTKQIGLFVAASMLAFACGAPSETVETTEAQEVAEATGQTLALKTDETVIAWRGYKPTGQHFGKIPATTGELVVADGTIKGGTFTFDITGLTIEDMEAGTENHANFLAIYNQRTSLMRQIILPLPSKSQGWNRSLQVTKWRTKKNSFPKTLQIQLVHYLLNHQHTGSAEI